MTPGDQIRFSATASDSTGDSRNHDPASLQLRRVLDSLFAFVAILSPDGTVIDVNQAPLKAGGLSLEDVVGRKFWEGAWWTHDEAVSERVREACDRAASGESSRFDVLIRSAAGGLMPIDFTVTPLRNDEGRIELLIPSAVDITERKKGEEALERSRDYLDRIVNSVADPIFVKDEKHRWVLLNDAYCAFMGYAREELIGKSDFDFFPEAEAKVFWEKDEAVFRSGEENVNEEFFTDAKGERHTIVTRKTLYVDPEGRRFIVGVIRDITRRRRMEENLRASEERYRLTVENLTQGLYTSRLGIFTSVNRAMCEIFGYSREELIGRPAWTMAVPERQEEMKNRFFAMARSGQYGPVEIECVRKDGKIFFAEVRISGTIGDEFFGLVMDVTERRLAEEARLRTRVQHAFDVILELDGSGKILYQSPAVERVMGYIPGTNVGKNAEDLIHPDDLPKMKEALVKGLAHRGEIQKIEIRARHADGTWRMLDMIGVDIAKEGEPSRIIINYRDATDRHRAEAMLRESYERLKELDKQKRDFLAAVAHELRTPLAIMLGAVDSLSAGKAGAVNEPQMKLVEILHRNAGRLGRLFDNLLDLARGEAGQLRIDRQRLDLRRPVQQAVESLQSLARKAERNLEWDLPEGPVMAMADADKVTQIISNLVDNAIRYARHEIRVSLSATTTEAVILVRDDGPGIDDEHIAHLFERYYRPDNQERRGHIGLGLYIVKTLAEAHGGRASVQREPGGGTRFEVALPLVQ